MNAARRLSSKLPLLTALLALLALCGAFLWSPGSPWSPPAEAQVTTRILVSNLKQGNGNAETTNGNDHAQLFHTGNATNGYLLTSVIVDSADPQGDDFDVEVCLAADDATAFPTSTCTELNPPGSFASGPLTFTAPGDGMSLQRNDNYTVVIKQIGTGSVILDSTTSGGEDSTGLSDWSIKNRFDWKDSGTWKQASGNEAIRIAVNGHEAQNRAATGRPVVLVSAEGPGILAADTWRIADADGLPYKDFKAGVDPPGSGGPDNGQFVFDFSYQWVRVDGGTETNVGADSPRYQLGDADFGKQLKVRVSFTDRFNNAESVTSVPFGPVVRPAPLPSPSTLVGNTGQSPAAPATISSEYAMGFRLGTHGQGYEISGVAIDLAAAPSSLSVSLWTGGPPGSSYAGSRSAKLFEFENPASFQVGLNEFTAPAGVYAYHGLDHWIVLSGFGSSLSINETTSDAEDAGGEPGAVLCNFEGNDYVVNEGEPNEMSFSCNDDPGANSGVVRLAIKGSQRDSGILAANFAQPSEGDQEIISVGDKVGFGIDLGAADRYLVRGLTLSADDTTPADGGFDNPFYFRSDSLSGARHFNLFQTRNVNGLPVWTAPQGATVAGRNTYVFELPLESSLYQNGSDAIERIGAVLLRVNAVAADADGRSDAPTAPGVSLAKGRSISGIDNSHYTAYMAVHGEPLYAVVQNLGRADNGYVSAGTINTVVSQGFTTGPLEDGYPLLGFGVNIEDSPSHFPESSASVAVALHADSGGKPGAKLFDLLSPTDYGAGHNFFEAPRGTVLDPETSYVLVWRHVSGISHRLQKTASNGEDPGAYAGFSMADAFHRGADLNNLAEDPGGNALEIAVYARIGNQPATGRPEVYPSADGAGILLADPFGIEDPNGLLVYNPQDEVYVRSYDWSYQWIRVDGETGVETEVGADSARYQPVDADTGHLLKVRVSFTDQAGYPEAVTSRPFGPMAEAAPSRAPSTLVSNTGRSSSATANITQQYAQGFRLGAHGQGYEISSVSLELAAAPSDLTVSLWMGAPPGNIHNLVAAYKVFDFENPASFRIGENRFTAPAGAFAYQNMNYFIVLSGFGSSLSIEETTANAEDPGGETGAVLFNDARVRALGETGRWTTSTTRAGALRLAIEGSQRASGILASNYGQVQDGQETISKGDDGGMPITLGAADRYIIRGFSWISDESTPDSGGIHNPFDLRSGWTLHGDGKINSAGKKWFGLIPTRYEDPGITLWTAPQGATVPGNGQYMVYEDYQSRPVGPVLTRTFTTSSDNDDVPTAPGATLSDAIGDLVGRPLMAFLGEPLVAMAQNLGQADNSYASLGGANRKVLSQGFTTGSDGFGYRLQGVGVNVEGSGGRVPDDSAAVSVAVHADSNGEPGAKLFDLVSPTEYGAGHSFFEAPAGTYLDPSADYVLVWTYNHGAWHRLQRTSSNGEDSGARTGASIADAYYLGADLDSLSVDSGGNALELAVYTEVLTEAPVRPGEIVIRLPTRALVSNVGQTSLMSGSQVTTNQRLAQAFRSGSEAATLDSVEVDVHTAPGTTSDVLVAIYTHESGQPGTKLYDLTNPSAIGTGAQKFTAPVGARLAADKNYFVVASTTSSTFRLRSTASGNEDAGGAEGWSIGNQRLYSTSTGWGSSHGPNQIRVNGHFSRTVTPTEVPYDWPLVPDEVGDEGGQFRLLFLTSGESAATSTDIDTYNAFVQAAAAAGHSDIRAYGEGFRAVASTAAVAARENTYTVGAGVPVYWLGGNRIADSYRDFYDGSWDDEENPTDESGGAASATSVWTGSAADGTKGVHDTHGATVLGGGAQAQAAFGTLDSATRGPLSGGHGWREIERPLYAVSEVFTVGPNPARITDLAITSDPGPDGMYRTGDEIEVTATFGAAVTVGGQPRVKLRLGQGEESDRWAEYERGGALFTGEAPELFLVRNNRTGGPPVASDALDSTTTKAAQAFTTGAEPNGYRLDSIGATLQFDNVATAGEHLTATLNANDNGDPGAALCTLTGPTRSTDDFTIIAYIFAAPPDCPALSRNTTYFLVIERKVVTTDDIYWFYLSNGSGAVERVLGVQGEPGFSIAESRYTYASGSWSEAPAVSGFFWPYGIEVTGAEALPPPPTMVSNTGQNLTVSHGLDDGESSRAQSFTTGAEPHGYTLSSVGIDFDGIGNPGAAREELTVTLNAEASGIPGDALCTLSAPASLTRSGVQVFDAHALCPKLTESTTYFVVVARAVDNTGDAITVAATSSGNEDAGSAAGWSIGNGGHVFSVQHGRWLSTSQAANQIEINGAAVPADYSPDQVVFTYRVQADDESDTDGVAVGVAGQENAIDLNQGSITLAGTSRGAVLGYQALDSDAGHLVNWARPTLVEAATSTDGRRLFLTFDEELNPDGSPPTSAFSVTVDGGAVALSGTTASVAGRVVALRLATPLDSAAQRLSVGYTDPSASDDLAAVEDVQGNDAASFRGRTATNRFEAVNRVFPGFPLVPAGVGVGDSFRLLFVTSTTRDATATDIEVYNAFVQAAAAAGHADIQDYSAGFFAVASTADADARDNTGTTYTSSNPGVPIHWLGGNQVADDYADFYDGDWDDEANVTDESGGLTASTLRAWSGSGHDGTEAFDGSRSLALGGDASDTAGIGLLNSTASGIGPLAGLNSARRNPRPLYGISEVFTVVDRASITDVAIVSDRGPGGNYVTGDELEVAVTFGRAVEIEGNPRIRLRLGDGEESVRWAEYERDPLVRNTGQPQFSGTALTAARPRVAQRFRTGGGLYVYELDAIGIKFHTIANPATAGDQLTVTLNADDNGSPAGTPLCTLSDPADFGATGLQTFDAPDAPDACPDLARETGYYVVVERLSFSAADTIAVWHTASPREDAGVVLGWSIGDRGHTDTGHTDTSSWSDGGPPFLIKVMGDLPAEFQDGVLISNTGQTQSATNVLTRLVPRLAQAFDTGAYPNGYRLSTIGIAFGTIDDTASAAEQLRVTLNAENNRIPSYALCTLSPPASFSENAVNRFDAASCPALARNTRYYVVAEHLTPETSDFFDWSTTISLGEDTGGAVGWNFIGVLHSFLAEGWITSGGVVHQIEVSGRRLSPAEQPAPPAPPAKSRLQVKNTGQTGSTLVSSALSSTHTKHAQAFTTGTSARGYLLSSLDVRFSTVTNPIRADREVDVALHAGGAADPGALLCELIVPSRLNQAAVARFPQSGNCPILEPNTTYFLVVERTAFTAGDTIETSAYTSNDEDSGSRPGWSIADDSRVFGTAWASGGGASLAIDVRAVDLPPEQPAEQPENLGPVQDLVSNTGQSLGTPDSLTGNLTKVAQKFTAGANHSGYRLSSLGIHFNQVNRFALSATTVTLNADASGEPGAALCTLVPPVGLTSDVSNAVLTYTAPASGAEACPTLEAGATYFVVVEQDVSEASLHISRTNSDAEDSGAAPGWSISNAIHAFKVSTSVWFESPGASYLIKISGAAVLTDPSAMGPAPQPRRFIYTVAAGDESTALGVAVGGSGATDDLDLSGGTITVVATGAEAPLDYTPLPQDGDHLVNWARPVLVRAGTSRDGSLVRLTFSEELETVGGAPTSRFTIKVDGEAVELTGIDVVAPIDAPIDTVSGTGGDDPPPAEEPWTVDAPREVPAGWALTPEGLGAGDEFRLLFLTSTKRDATSSDIDDYNTFVQTAAAAGHADIQEHSDGFYAVASTADDDARDNTETTYTASDKGVPIYWLGGNQLADDYEDFYDGTWDDEANPTDESGGGTTSKAAWTGSLNDGTKHTVSSTWLGNDVFNTAALGILDDTTTGNNPLTGGARAQSESFPLYALSLPFVVAPTAPREVPADWALTPEGLDAGDEFRLLFLTSTKRDATSSDIDDYNTFVQTAAAAGHTAVQDYSDGFYAVASTADDDARDNTETTYTASDKGVPIYWLGGNQLADDYEDFYDGDWDDEANPTDESGGGTTSKAAWTGSLNDGTKHTVSSTWLGNDVFNTAALGILDDTTTGNNPLTGGARAQSESFPLYALSLPFVVAESVEEPAPLVEPQVLGSVVTLELVTPLTSPEQEVTVSYADPSPRDDTGVIEDLVGNDAESFIDWPVTNRVAFLPPPVEVPADWALVPGGLPAGAEFRLLFLTSGGRDATSALIEDYDDFVQAAAAGGHGAIREYAGGFFAVASTPDTDARDNTGTTYTASNRGVPIYWLGGAQVADNYADLYDGSWDDEAHPTDESGDPRRVSASADHPWTGSSHDGTEATEGGRSLALGGSGSAVVVGAPNVAEPGIGPLDGGDARPTGLRPLYALSQVFVVAALPVPAGSAIVPEGLSDGDRFRLLFLTSTTRDATSSDIADYNDFIQTAAAGGHAGIQAFSDGFQAVASTAQVDARENTWTRTTGVPIYWLGGAKLADDYADFYDGTWDAEAGATDESGGARGVTTDADRAWTGSDHDGTEAFNGSIPVGLGGSETGRVVVGQLDSPVPGHGPLRAGLIAPSAGQPLYGLSPVLVVLGPPDLPTDPTDVPGVPPARQTDAPTGLVAQPGNESVTLSWDRSDVSVTYYQYEQDGRWNTKQIPGTTFTVEDLNNRETYRFRVRAVGGVGTGDPSASRSATPAAQPPDPPTGLQAVYGNGSVQLTWTAPDSDGGQTITHYEYEQDGDWETTGSRETTFTVTGLANDRTYAFRVQAANGVGASRPSNCVTAGSGSGDGCGDG